MWRIHIDTTFVHCYNVSQQQKSELVRMMEKSVKESFGEAVLARMRSKMVAGGKCDLCFGSECDGYCFPCNIAFCMRCGKQHRRQKHGV